VIAEAGVNHNGDPALAKRLIEAAAEAGADAVKFHVFESKKLWGDDRIKHLELRYAEMEKLYQFCEEIGIEFMCTPFGVAELIFLKPMLKRVKVASGCITRKPLLEEISKAGLPVILSTGMSDMDDVVLAVETLGSVPITLLHCTSSYPCRLEDVNLLAMEELETLGLPVCYSDHTNGITVAIAAAARGAVVIEKHLTMDRNAEGPDHKSSITPREMKALHLALIEVDAALGTAQKRVLDCERPLRTAWRGH